MDRLREELEILRLEVAIKTLQHRSCQLRVLNDSDVLGDHFECRTEHFAELFLKEDTAAVQSIRVVDKLP